MSFVVLVVKHRDQAEAGPPLLGCEASGGKCIRFIDSVVSCRFYNTYSTTTHAQAHMQLLFVIALLALMLMHMLCMLLSALRCESLWAGGRGGCVRKPRNHCSD